MEMKRRPTIELALKCRLRTGREERGSESERERAKNGGICERRTNDVEEIMGKIESEYDIVRSAANAVECVDCAVRALCVGGTGSDGARPVARWKSFPSSRSARSPLAWKST